MSQGAATGRASGFVVILYDADRFKNITRDGQAVTKDVFVKFLKDLNLKGNQGSGAAIFIHNTFHQQKDDYSRKYKPSYQNLMYIATPLIQTIKKLG